MVAPYDFAICSISTLHFCTGDGGVTGGRRNRLQKTKPYSLHTETGRCSEKGYSTDEKQLLRRSAPLCLVGEPPQPVGHRKEPPRSNIVQGLDGTGEGGPSSTLVPNCTGGVYRPTPAPWTGHWEKLGAGTSPVIRVLCGGTNWLLPT